MGAFILVTVCILAAFSSQINADNDVNRVPKVWGGVTAMPEGDLYQVAIKKHNGRICSGALISSQWVLTSAVCSLSLTQLTVLAGLKSLDNWDSAIRATPYPHPQFNPKTLANDIALLRLDQPVSVSGTMLIPLPTTFTKYYYGLTARISGWGALSDTQTHNPDLSSRVLSIALNSNCKGMDYPATEGYKICTYGRAVCEGDQGAPLVRFDTLIGVASAASDALVCADQASAQFTNVNYYMVWIANTIRIYSK